MRTSHLLLSTLILTAAAGAAAAQTYVPAPARETNRMTAGQQSSRFEAEEQRRRSLTPEEAEAEFGAARVDLARRVQALVDAGECRAARELANAEGDRNMALRVRQTCRR